MAHRLCLFLLLLWSAAVSADTFDPLRVTQPNVALVSEQDGDIKITAGDYANVVITPGANGRVFLDDADLLELIQIIESQPPVWEVSDATPTSNPYGFLGAFKAGDTVSIGLVATDPEGTQMTYTRVAGDLPPGLSITSTSGLITGLVPDADATYVFTIRATDGHGKFADNRFRIVTRGYDSCSSSPCLHEGLCTDTRGSFVCQCVRPYGGTTCDLYCPSNPLGIQEGLQYVTDAQMTAYMSHSSHSASNARLDSTSGWIGLDSASYLQIDFSNITDIHRVDIQYYYSLYYTTSLYLQYSLDGEQFSNYTDYMGDTLTLTGINVAGTESNTLETILTARYVRLFPLSWHPSHYPAMRVEMYGCYGYTVTSMT